MLWKAVFQKNRPPPCLSAITEIHNGTCPPAFMCAFPLTYRSVLSFNHIHTTRPPAFQMSPIPIPPLKHNQRHYANPWKTSNSQQGHNHGLPSLFCPWNFSSESLLHVIKGVLILTQFYSLSPLKESKLKRIFLFAWQLSFCVFRDLWYSFVPSEYMLMD